MKEPQYPLTVAQQKRMVFLLQKYLSTVNRRPGDRSHAWDLTKCDDETRKLFAQMGLEF
jgi:hypothetical protein